MKFGGTSVASAERWRTISAVLQEHVARGLKPLVVCSAVAGISDQLVRVLDRQPGERLDAELGEFERTHLRLGEELSIEVEDLVRDCVAELEHRLTDASAPSPERRAEWMAWGELLATRIGARWLRAQGLSTVWQDARQILYAAPSEVGACPQQRYLSATCSHAYDPLLERCLRQPAADSVITQGFIARDPSGRTVLLGRGGSDTAAAYFAAKLGAVRLEIWTDVPGVFTANPNQIPAARLIPRLSYDEAETVAGFGAKVLHPRCIRPLRDREIPLHLRWIEDPAVEGTQICTPSAPADHGIRAVVARRNLCLISFNRSGGWQPVGFMADVASCFKRHAISMDLVASSPTSIQTTLDLSLGPGVEEKVPVLVRDLQALYRPEVDFDVASVSIVGTDLRATLDRLAPTLEVLESFSPSMITFGADDSHFTAVVPRAESTRLLEKLHDLLITQHPPGNLPLGPPWSEFRRGRQEETARACA